MAQLGLSDYFEQFLEKETIFQNKKVLQANYIPDVIPHRKRQIEFVASILAVSLRQEKPSNLFIYGKTGTGKTTVIHHVSENLINIAKKKKIPLKTIYINCKLKKVADTEYRIIAELARILGQDIPATGLPTDEVYNLFLKSVDKEDQVVVLILDEIDRLIEKAGDNILYSLTRINAELKNAQLSLVGISNDVRFIENIDSRIKSSLGEEEIVFPPYNALELRDILDKRAKLAFEENVVEPGVLEKCSAYAAREHGDARRALDLLRVAAEVSERDSNSTITPNHIDKAEEKIEKNRVLEIVQTQPKQSQVVLLSILELIGNTQKKIETGEVFEKYRELCKNVGLNILTQRRISDLISELDMLGLINAKVISKGRYGRTREIYITIPEGLLEQIKTSLREDML